MKKMPTLTEALQDANPKYKKGVKNLYSTNCQRCVVALEARLRGLDVEALPALSMDKTKDEIADGVNWLKAFKIKKGTKQLSFSSLQDIEETFKKLPTNSRMQILIREKDKNITHVFVAMKDNTDKVHFVDPQNALADCRRYFNKNLDLILGARIDDLELKKDMLPQYVKGK